MRDGYLIKGKQIDYMGQNWTIVDFWYVPNNPNIYIQLNNGSCNMNVTIDSIKNLIVSD
jgi:hypothetical protein